MTDRLESIARQNGLGSHLSPTGTECYITSDMFYVEVQLDSGGQLLDVKVAHHGENPALFILEVLLCLRSATNANTVETVLHGSVGLLTKRSGGHLMNLKCYVSPYDIFEEGTGTLLNLNDSNVPRSLGLNVSVTIEGTVSLYKLPIAPLVTGSHPVDSKGERNFEEFSKHLKGLVNLYKLPGDDKLKTKMYLSLQSLEIDLSKMMHMFRSATNANTVETVLHGSVGLLTKRSGGHLMNLKCYVSPYDIFEEGTGTLLNLNDSNVPRSLGLNVSVTIEGTVSLYKLPIAPLVTGSHPVDSKGTPSFSSVTNTNCVDLPACFFLKLERPMPVCLSFIQRLHSCTGLLQFEVCPLTDTSFSVSFQHPVNESLVCVVMDVVDSRQVCCKLYKGLSDALICTDDFITKVVQRCMSIPVTMRAIRRKAETIQADTPALSLIAETVEDMVKKNLPPAGSPGYGMGTGNVGGNPLGTPGGGAGGMTPTGGGCSSSYQPGPINTLFGMGMVHKDRPPVAGGDPSNMGVSGSQQQQQGGDDFSKVTQNPILTSLLQITGSVGPGSTPPPGPPRTGLAGALGGPGSPRQRRISTENSSPWTPTPPRRTCSM
ncbi:UNVERIFIED_CONTAM: hypothetical protein FKN15_044356 [Acipenser sinensis]